MILEVVTASTGSRARRLRAGIRPSACGQQPPVFAKADARLQSGTGYPFVELTNGGTLAGLLAGLGDTIGRAGPTSKIIPGHGPTADRAALIAQRDMVLAVRDRVAMLVAQGKSLEEVIAAKPTGSFDTQVPQSAQTAERFIRWLYAEVKVAQH